MISIIVALLAVSSLLFIGAPKMPLYQIMSLKMTKFRLNFSTLAVTTEIMAGIQIQNENIVGADLHATIIDLYYPDWNGNLTHIGFAKETISTSDGDDGTKRMCMKKNNSDEMKENKKRQKKEKENNDHGICLPDGHTSLNSSSTPFFTIKPRGTSISESDAVTIFVNDLSPKVYLNLVKDAIIGIGSLELFISGAAHIKSPPGIPLSVGLMCENSINLLQIPTEILGKNCEVRSASAGFARLSDVAAKVRKKALGIITKRITARNEKREKDKKFEQNKNDFLELIPTMTDFKQYEDWT